MVIFEGIDKVGKTTLFNAVNKILDYQYMTVDRYLVTALAMAIRHDRPWDWELIRLAMPKNILVIHVIAEEEDVISRLLLHCHEYIDIKEDSAAFVTALTLMSLYCNQNDINFNVITVNTSKASVEELSELISKDIIEWANLRKNSVFKKN